MGASASKSAPHVWTGSAPPSVSQDLIDQLQASPETLELHVQARVADELARLQAQQLANRAAAEQALAVATETEDARSGDGDNGNDGPSSGAVRQEIAALRSRLEARQREVHKPLPASVDAARSAVVRCLHEQNRRPLNCYEEVAAFKEEVRKLEATWVDRVVA